MRPLLAHYLDDRLRFDRTHDSAQLRLLAEETNLLKQEMWTNVVLIPDRNQRRLRRSP
jgi:hypothetical protein